MSVMRAVSFGFVDVSVDIVSACWRLTSIYLW